jgi:hypothetical protein
MRIGDTQYAAKRFYRLHDEESSDEFQEISYEENFENLKDELHRQQLASIAASRFVSEAQELKVSIYGEFIPSHCMIIHYSSYSTDLCTEQAIILVVTEGPSRGLSWLVDRLDENVGDFQKFSGTEEAGNNPNSLLGKTCDAFAHFTYVDSDQNVVFVDIQGNFFFIRLCSSESLKTTGLTFAAHQDLTLQPFLQLLAANPRVDVSFCSI